jgi:hypothetical protein
MILRTFLTMSLLLFLGGCKGSGRFGVHSSLLGQFATAVAHGTEKGNRYSMTIKVTSEGLINLLRGKRVETYHSEGKIRHGQYYAQLFSVDKKTDKQHSLIEYRFDYGGKKIVRHFHLWQKGKLIETATDKMKYFGHNDFLTIFHNVLYKQPKTSGKRLTIITAAAENNHGKVPVYISNDPKRLKRWGGAADGTLVQLGIHKAIFSGGHGSMTVLLDAKQAPQQVIVKKLKVVGTVTAKPSK